MFCSIALCLVLLKQGLLLNPEAAQQSAILSVPCTGCGYTLTSIPGLLCGDLNLRSRVHAASVITH